jgi:hypothetical protein
LSLNLLVSTARLLWMFNFDPALGPLQLMMARMVKDVTRFVVLFVVAFAGFVLAIYQMWCVARPTPHTRTPNTCTHPSIQTPRYVCTLRVTRE